MVGREDYFLLNKASDFERGFCLNMEIAGGGIRPAGATMATKGIFVSRLLDSRREQMNWHRLTLVEKSRAEGAFRLGIYTSDERTFVHDGVNLDMEEFIRDEKVAWEEKQAAMSGYLKKQVTDICDVLLLDIYGRYLWIVIEMFRQHEATGIFDIKIEFPGHSIIAYLPDYYQQEDREGFLERYLAIFQTIYEDRSREIMGQAHNYDVESADADALYELASWIGVIRPRVWPEDRLRRFLREGVDLFRMRGTRQGLSRIIELYTGEVPYIVEARELYPFRWREAYFEELVRLYGEDENQFMILLPQSVVNTPLQQKIVRQLINEMRPAHIEYHLVLLVPYIFAGRYSYLGINTVLGEYSSLKLDGQSAVSFTGLKGGTE